MPTFLETVGGLMSAMTTRDVGHVDAAPGPAACVVGSVVTFGPAEYQHSVYLVTGLDGGEYVTLGNRDFPQFTIMQVRAGQFTATGDTAPLCTTCLHEPRRADPDTRDRCAVRGCRCIRHPIPTDRI